MLIPVGDKVKLRPVLSNDRPNKKVKLRPKLANDRQNKKDGLTVDIEVRAATSEQDRRAPIKMVGRCAWSPGIYWTLQLLGKSLDVAWARAFVHSLTFNS